MSLLRTILIGAVQQHSTFPPFLVSCNHCLHVLGVLATLCTTLVTTVHVTSCVYVYGV